MINKKVFKLASLIPLLLMLASCSSVSKVKDKPLKQGVSNPVLCPVTGGEVGLYSLDGQNNIINPKYVDMSVTGRVSLKTDYTYGVSPGSRYTFVFYGDFNDAYRGGGNICEGFNIEMSYQYNYPRNEKYSSGSTSSLKSVVSATYDNVVLKMEMDCSKMFMEFYTPYTTQSNISIKACSFVFDNTGSGGKVSATQLYKGTIEDYPGLDISYNHDLCLPSLDENLEGPFENGHIYDLQCEYGKVPSVNTLKNTLTAYDVAEGNYKDILVDSDGLTGHESVLDSPMDVVFKSTDKSHNTSKFTYRITIVDTCKPDIEVINESRKVSYTSNINNELILENYKVTDNYPDGVKEVEVLNIDNTQENFVGVIHFQIKATDISNNVQTIDGSLEVIDDVVPIIDGPLELNLNASEPQEIEEILKNYEATDTINGSVDVIVENETYTNNKNRPGTYVINLKATDASGNVGKLSVKAVVQDKDGPIFYVNKTTITTFSKKTLSSDELLRSAIIQGAIPQKNYTSCEVVEGEYGFVDEVEDYGTYNVKLLAHAEDGSDEYVLITIEVKEQNKPELSFFEKVKMFFINIWNKIVSFFTNGF